MPTNHICIPAVMHRVTEVVSAVTMEESLHCVMTQQGSQRHTAATAQQVVMECASPQRARHLMKTATFLLGMNARCSVQELPRMVVRPTHSAAGPVSEHITICSGACWLMARTARARASITASDQFTGLQVNVSALWILRGRSQSHAPENGKHTDRCLTYVRGGGQCVKQIPHSSASTQQPHHCSTE